jgi:hypothetical protein
VAGRGLYPEAPQQAGDHKIVLLGRRGPQLRPRPAPLEEKHRRLRQLAYPTETYCPGSVPRPEAVGLMCRLRVRPADLEREVPARIVASRGHPGGHAARKERGANLDPPLGRDPPYESRQLGEPVVASLSRSRPRKVIGDHEAFGHADHSRACKAGTCLASVEDR